MGDSLLGEKAAAHFMGSVLHNAALPGAYAPGFMLPPSSTAYL